nr:unnamed protein product [Spirometra erinaceieuropaei]
MDFCLPTTALSAPPNANEHRPLRHRLRRLRSGHKHGEDGGHASTATQRHLRRIPNQRERRPAANRGQFNRPRQQPLPHRIPDTDVLEPTGTLSIYTMMRQLQLRWGGLFVHKDDGHLNDFPRCRNGFPPTRSSPSLHGYSEDFPEASADQPGQLERPRPRPTDLEEDSECRCGDLRSQPHHRRQSQTLGSQMLTPPTSQRQRSTSPDMSTMPAGVPDTNPPSHTSAWSVICESIAQRLANQSLARQPTLAAFASNVHSPGTFTRRMCLFGHARIHESGLDRGLDTPSTSCTSAMVSSTHTPPHSAHIISSSATATNSEADTPNSPVHNAHVNSRHTSAWSVTCESVAQKLANQCLEQQHTPDTPASTSITAPAQSPTAWAYQATCAFTQTCGRQPQAKPRHHIFLHLHHATSSTFNTGIQLPHPTQVVCGLLGSVSMLHV